MNPDKDRQDEAIDRLLAAAFGKGPCGDVTLDTILAAFTPEQRAALNQLGNERRLPKRESNASESAGQGL